MLYKMSNTLIKIIFTILAIVPIIYYNKIEDVPFKVFILGTGSWGIGLVFKMLGHHFIVTKLHKKKVKPIYESLANGIISGFFELFGAYLMIILMLPKFEFDYNSIICFGLAIGSLETLIVGFNGDNLLKGTTLEPSANKLIHHLKNLKGYQYYFGNYVLPIAERILASFIHISTRGMIFLVVITGSIVPAIIALIIFVIADGLLGYYFMISEKFIENKKYFYLYINLFILAAISSVYFFSQMNYYKDVTL